MDKFLVDELIVFEFLVIELTSSKLTSSPVDSIDNQKFKPQGSMLSANYSPPWEGLGEALNGTNQVMSKAGMVHSNTNTKKCR